MTDPQIGVLIFDTLLTAYAGQAIPADKITLGVRLCRDEWFRAWQMHRAELAAITDDPMIVGHA